MKSKMLTVFFSVLILHAHSQSAADTVLPAAPGMVAAQTESGDLAIFCTYGAELFVVIPKGGNSYAELAKYKDRLLEVVARSKVKMKHPNDIEHAWWKDTAAHNNAYLSTPLKKGSIEVVYSFQGDSIAAASTLKRPNGHTTTITTKHHFLTIDRNKFNTTLRAVHARLIAMAQQ